MKGTHCALPTHPDTYIHSARRVCTRFRSPPKGYGPPSLLPLTECIFWWQKGPRLSAKLPYKGVAEEKLVYGFLFLAVIELALEGTFNRSATVLQLGREGRGGREREGGGRGRRQGRGGRVGMEQVNESNDACEQHILAAGGTRRNASMEQTHAHTLHC